MLNHWDRENPIIEFPSFLRRRVWGTSRCWGGAGADAGTDAHGGAGICPHGRLVIKHKLRVDGAPLQSRATVFFGTQRQKTSSEAHHPLYRLGLSARPRAPEVAARVAVQNPDLQHSARAPDSASLLLFITAVPIIKLSVRGEGDSGGHVLCDATSLCLCGLFCPARTSERGGKGDCVIEGGGEEGERERERALGMRLRHNPQY